MTNLGSAGSLVWMRMVPRSSPLGDRSWNRQGIKIRRDRERLLLICYWKMV